MANLGDWSNDAEKMTDEELRTRLAALENIKEWPMFQKEFRWTGIFTLIITLEAEIERRERKAMTPAPAKPPKKIPFLVMERRFGAGWMVWVRNWEPWRRYFDDDSVEAAVNIARADGVPLYRKVGNEWHLVERLPVAGDE